MYHANTTAYTYLEAVAVREEAYLGDARTTAALPTRIILSTRRAVQWQYQAQTSPRTPYCSILYMCVSAGSQSCPSMAPRPPQYYNIIRCNVPIVCNAWANGLRHADVAWGERRRFEIRQANLSHATMGWGTPPQIYATQYNPKGRTAAL